MHRPQALQLVRSRSTGTSPVRGLIWSLRVMQSLAQASRHRPQPLQYSGSRKGLGRSLRAMETPCRDTGPTRGKCHAHPMCAWSQAGLNADRRRPGGQEWCADRAVCGGQTEKQAGDWRLEVLLPDAPLCGAPLVQFDADPLERSKGEYRRGPQGRPESRTSSLPPPAWILPVPPVQLLLQQGEEIEAGTLEEGDAGPSLAQANFVAGQQPMAHLAIQGEVGVLGFFQGDGDGLGGGHHGWPQRQGMRADGGDDKGFQAGMQDGPAR